jgi:hypothetical protein
MVHPHHTTHESTRRLPVGQLALQDVPPQQEPQHGPAQNVPQEKDPYEVELMAPKGQRPQVESAEECQVQQKLQPRQ